MNVQVHIANAQRSRLGGCDFENILLGTLERFQHRLKQVYLYIEDLNGPRGGVDKQCRCVLHLRRMPPIVVQDRDESLTSLIHRVANRAAYALSQKTDRRNKHVLRGRVRRRRRRDDNPERDEWEDSTDPTA